MSHSRYALYLAPPPDSDLWRFGSEVLGRDAGTGEAFGRFAPEGYEIEAWRKLTSEPRRYGFHVTLKAPFRLRIDLDVVDLMDRVASFARRHSPFDAGELHVGHMILDDGRDFAVLKPEGQSKGLRALEAAAVRGLDDLRESLSPAERLRRRESELNPRQSYYLDAWGYPYVLDEFRPHFTLTNPLPNAEQVAKVLKWEFQMRVASPALRVDSVALFGERASDGQFEIVRTFPLGHAKRARRQSPRVAAAAFID
jgi:hypothetical protein